MFAFAQKRGDGVFRTRQNRVERMMGVQLHNRRGAKAQARNISDLSG